MQRRIIAYGDIHGCLEELKQLRKEINPTKEDIEVSVGDFLNKGPYSHETLEYIRQNNILSIMGNNEANIIKLYHKWQKKGASFFKTIRRTTQTTLNEMTKKDISYLEKLPYYLKIENLTFVHGGIKNSTILSDQMNEKEKKLITQLRYYNKKGEPIPYDDFEHRDKFWSEVYDGHEGFIVFGHHPFPQPKVDQYALGIDTGCVYGGALTAAIFNYDKEVDVTSYQLHSIKAFRNYFR